MASSKKKDQAPGNGSPKTASPPQKSQPQSGGGKGPQTAQAEPQQKSDVAAAEDGRAPANRPPAPPTSSENLTPPTANPDAKAGTVLYVEDDESDALFMQMAFAGAGLESALQVVTDGQRALDYLSGTGPYADRAKNPLPSLILLDLNLPRLPGFEVLKWMRNHPDFAQTPVVIFSSSMMEEDRVKARELGASEFVAKPSSGMEFGGVLQGLRKKWRI
jgi:CheY-like chemotaxis protein